MYLRTLHKKVENKACLSNKLYLPPCYQVKYPIVWFPETIIPFTKHAFPYMQAWLY